jgi:hypothetical protein
MFGQLPLSGSISLFFFLFVVTARFQKHMVPLYHCRLNNVIAKIPQNNKIAITVTDQRTITGFKHPA